MRCLGNSITFILNANEKIVSKWPCLLEDLYSCDEGAIFLVQGTENMVLSESTIYEDMYVFAVVLKKVLAGDFWLHPSITQDVGLLWNDVLQGLPGMVYQQLGERTQWVGEEHLVWVNTVATWLYNDVNGTIIFSVTPVYPGQFIVHGEPNPYEPYAEWRKHYKPLITRIIPLELAQIWCVQAGKIVDQIDRNAVKMCGG